LVTTKKRNYENLPGNSKNDVLYDDVHDVRTTSYCQKMRI